MNEIRIAALYKFVEINDLVILRERLLEKCKSLDIKGTFILASEGINGTVAGNQKSVDEIADFLMTDKRFEDLECKFSSDVKNPFYRMKVKIKEELIPIGIEVVDPRKKVGTYVSPDSWNKIVEDPETLLIDVRNDYEIEVGTFRGAINPKTENFREFPEFVRNNLDPEKHKKIAIFCTGGIRCEKASSFMIGEGFTNVYHLKGGILKYLEEVPSEESTWEGECFVFDNRTSVDHDLENGVYDLCHNCRFPVSPEDMKSEYYEKGISCPKCYNTISESRRKSLEERNKQIRLAKQRNQQHLGVDQKTLKTTR